PMAIDAGFGEQGRNGKLITPQFGPGVRLCKVITDLPLLREYPVQFGVKKFCTICKKCAENCPVKAIPFGEPTWSVSSKSHNPGIFTWHLNDEACRKYWATKPGTNCTVCLRTCPFSKSPGINHDLARFLISYTPVLNPLLVKLDNLMGYGEQRQVERFWE
ncbi:reductive dehalogenase, partial [Chloroflexota bacterium]